MRSSPSGRQIGGNNSMKNKNKILYLEDPLAEDQTPDWVQLHQQLPDKIIAGDALIATSSQLF